ncbi:hypothetical protein A1O1_07952 [Capronia coronata CBS 617.96]|uniref:Uncharacterized protein n=1 Tax=Capronia coronata CBS 617.96 TaxID=1182541 RepID=W9XMZ6_9EURO|nr:uncharacterized protein A1O1_07952 [Capronia coronata CBS 617.96]EXJ81887.1 hypothetical protein A1O1_07952 [Capronia coronata CBS 617.96]
MVLDFMDEPPRDEEPSAVRPRKRQAGASPITPSTSAAGTIGQGNPEEMEVSSMEQRLIFQKANVNPQTMPPPPTPSTGNTSKDVLVKTPCPDITIGLDDIFVVKKLKSQGLSNTRANYVLDKLQQQTTHRHLSAPEPLLCSEPTQRAYQMRFPFLIVEGKSYATGKPIFEAQNQAAVSGAGALKILHDLADIAARAATSTVSADSTSPATNLGKKGHWCSQSAQKGRLMSSGLITPLWRRTFACSK